ncbi:MAG: LpxL/LpxP family Kdo(2)-lipid IV(A) lauroyl/palmitoleoyl acyltransferase [Shewanella sp.]|nr:LpxL/LpxP family Kdo(2)-lipid IV(A) lauroyl/palmitoleoyl acyltransferase [Shewanella sp.]MCF1431590.1 LpxL/LpxP family Kdo(2)-lipid IV(A) lauroyl/palmitoleoyl acyltransferase [Shewanella sp.]MCF1438069.1 LpxL/LpxP family Kdo(2)-lipid IV(A) lauroyl/palmitoleoyl acyltransferase [Shewanella sp.]MCF1458322.1 LpxL/LpxP family Kdo(2)-lipid IV(A) lauroyl/palmitoleoyl acyltransferase [Shewanella sp.]
MNKYPAPKFSVKYLLPQHWGTLLLVAVVYLVSLLPWRLQFWLGKGIGRLSMLLLPRRRRIIERNLELCFPGMSVTERQQLVNANIDNTGLGLLETGMAWYWSDARIARHVSFEGFDHIEPLLAQGHGVLLVSVHSLNLELGARACGLKLSGMGVYRPNNNPCFDYFQYKGRTRGRHEMIHRKDVKTMLDSLRQGRVLWYAPDHDYGLRRSAFVPLFAVDQACTTTGTSLLVDETDCAIVPFTIVRTDDSGHYTVTFREPLQEAFPKHSPEGGARAINKLVETSILAAPSQYMWLHRRFKTRPEGQPSLY